MKNPSASSERESFEARYPYLFVLLLTVFFLGVSLFGGALIGVLTYPVLASIAAVFVTRKHSWKSIGFIYSGTNKRSLLLFTPVFVAVLWWLAIAPMIGYGTLQFSDVGTVSTILSFTLLIGFVEEIYFRGIMLQALKRKGLWTATIVTSLLFGAAHSTNILGGASPIYTLLQVGYAVPLGLSFAALALVTKLIWPLVLAHGLVNFGAYVNSAAGGAISTTVTQMDYVLTAVLLVTFTTYAIVLLQKGRAISLIHGQIA